MKNDKMQTYFKIHELNSAPHGLKCFVDNNPPQVRTYPSIVSSRALRATCPFGIAHTLEIGLQQIFR